MALYLAKINLKICIIYLTNISRHGLINYLEKHFVCKDNRLNIRLNIHKKREREGKQQNAWNREIWKITGEDQNNLLHRSNSVAQIKQRCVYTNSLKKRVLNLLSRSFVEKIVGVYLGKLTYDVIFGLVWLRFWLR